MNEQQSNRQFRVSVGFASVTVECPSREDVIQIARRRLCDDMPRLWDVIRQLDESRFQIVPIS